jgi:hypothetical protein
LTFDDVDDGVDMMDVAAIVVVEGQAQREWIVRK